MTYPPGTPGYPPAQSPGSYGAPSASSASAFGAPDARDNKLPLILGAVVAVLGLLVFLSGFAPRMVIESAYSGSMDRSGLDFDTALAVIAGLLAAVGLVPAKDADGKGARSFTPVVAVLAVTSMLWVVSNAFTSQFDSAKVGWGLWLALVLVVLQAFAAVAALLLETGIISAPAPKPSYPQYSPYGQYAPQSAPAGYYSQPGQPGQPGQPAQQPGQPGQSAQAPGADQQTVVHSPYQSQPGGYSANPQHAQNHAASTPPTGFPGYSGSSGAGSAGSESGSAGSADNAGSAGPTPS